MKNVKSVIVSTFCNWFQEFGFSSFNLIKWKTVMQMMKYVNIIKNTLRNNVLMIFKLFLDKFDSFN